MLGLVRLGPHIRGFRSRSDRRGSGRPWRGGACGSVPVVAPAFAIGWVNSLDVPDRPSQPATHRTRPCAGRGHDVR
jgi:hypothetical protein